jgi:hypothetical protein
MRFLSGTAWPAVAVLPILGGAGLVAYALTLRLCFPAALGDALLVIRGVLGRRRSAEVPHVPEPPSPQIASSLAPAVQE